MGEFGWPSGFFVLDQNVLQRPVLTRFIEAHPGAKFVIPDTSFVEMVKSEQWAYTFRRNFEQLVPVVTRCFMTLSVAEAMTMERETHRSVEGKLLPRDFTQFLREVIRGSQLNEDNATMQMLRTGMEGVRRDLAKNDLNPTANRRMLEEIVDKAKKELTLAELKECRQSGDVGRFARLKVVVGAGGWLFRSYLANEGVPEQVIRRLWSSKSMTRRWAYMQIHNAMQWLGDGGLESAQDENVLNDILDQDYVLLGSFFSGVVTLENSVRRAHEDLVLMLRVPLALPNSVA